MSHLVQGWFSFFENDVVAFAPASDFSPIFFLSAQYEQVNHPRILFAR